MERMESLESSKNALLMLLEVSPNFLRAWFIGKRKEKALSYSLRLFSKQWPNHVTENLSLYRFNAYKHVLSVHYLFADGHAVRVGCYDAFAKKLQLVGKGNLWPGNRVRKNLNFIWAYSLGQLQPAFSDFFSMIKEIKVYFLRPSKSILIHSLLGQNVKWDSGKVRSSTPFRIRRQERSLELGGTFLIRSFFFMLKLGFHHVF